MTEQLDEPRASGEKTTEQQVRVAGRGIVMAYGAYGNHEKVLALGPEVALISAGIDPDAIDTESADYKAGAVEAFSVIMNSMLEMKPAEQQG